MFWFAPSGVLRVFATIKGPKIINRWVNRPCLAFKLWPSCLLDIWQWIYFNHLLSWVQGISVVRFFLTVIFLLWRSGFALAVALSILFYDRWIHFDEEVEDIWSNLQERTWLKVMFLCGRYTSEAFVAYTAVGKLRHWFHMNVNSERIAYSYWWLQHQFDPRGVNISEGSLIIIYWLSICSCKTYFIVMIVLLQVSVVGTEGVLIGLWQSIN